MLFCFYFKREREKQRNVLASVNQAKDAECGQPPFSKTLALVTVLEIMQE